MSQSYILRLSCRDGLGIVQSVSGFLSQKHCNIEESAQFGDPATGFFFMRVRFRDYDSYGLSNLSAEFASIATKFGMDWDIVPVDQPIKAVIMVSKFGHVLNDLLYRVRIGSLPLSITNIVSNHEDFADLAQGASIAYHHWPVTPARKKDHEARLQDLMKESQSELLILARYMQILSPEFCARWPGRIINIHHSFLPSFKGAKPYQQAFARGVKLIGATAHYVTSDLDDGPIIDQEVARVDHTATPAQMSAVGRDLESIVMARAVMLHLHHRIFVNGNKTVIF